MALQRAKTTILCANCRKARRKCEPSKTNQACRRCRQKRLDCDLAQSLSSPTGPPSTNHKASPTNPQAPPALPLPPEVPTPTQYLTSYEDSQVIKGVNRIVVGVDVGTDSSSACWASLPRTFTLSPKTVLEVINVRVEKDHRIPTEAAILPASNGAATIIYGPEVERSLSRGLVSEADIFRLLKLGLVQIDPAEASERAEAIRQVHAAQQTALSRAPHSVINKHAGPSTQLTVDSILDVLEGFRAYLWNQIKRDIDKRMGLQPAELAKVLRDDVVVSIAMPAIWEDAWIDAFRKRVARAGFPNFHVVSEPKCSAAVVAHSKMRKVIETHTSKGQTKALERLKKVTMIIVDIGHGTADLTTCRIEGIKPLKMKTLFKGVGSMYGSKALNDHVKHMIKYVIGDRFETLLERVAGPDASDDALLDHFARDFDKNEKRTFDIDTEQDVNIFYPTDLPHIPGVPALKSRSVTLTAEQLMNVYKWYLPNITLQIDEQIQAIKKLGLGEDETVEIIGVGGGTLAPCVMSLLREYYYPVYRVTSEESTEYSIVAKGALLTSIDPDLGRRHFARTAYGTAMSVPYDPDKHSHLDAKPVESSFSEWKYEVENRVTWLFIIGERLVGRTKPLVLTGHIYLDEKDVDIRGPIELEQEIFRTTNESVCVSDVFDAYQTPQIHPAGTLTLPIAPHEHAFQWRPGPLGDRDVEIAFRALPRWDGMQMYWRFVVHETGVFANEDVEDETGCIVKEMVLEDVLVYEEME